MQITTRTLQLAVRTLLIAGVVSCISACASGGPAPASSGPTTEPELGIIPTISRSEQVKRPIDAYLPNTSEILKLVSVETRKVNICLGGKAISGTYSPSADPAQLAPFISGATSDNVERSDLWGYFNTDHAEVAQYGYKRPASQPGVLLASVPPGSDDALSGCMTEADAGLPGDGSAATALGTPKLLPQRGPDVPLSDSRWLAAEATWASCMSDEGFPAYTTPLAAIGDPQWAKETSSSAADIATATADMSCKVKTNLVGIGVAIQSAYDQLYIQQNRSALDDYREQLTAYLSE